MVNVFLRVTVQRFDQLIIKHLCKVNAQKIKFNGVTITEYESRVVPNTLNKLAKKTIEKMAVQQSIKIGPGALKRRFCRSGCHGSHSLGQEGPRGRLACVL